MGRTTLLLIAIGLTLAKATLVELSYTFNKDAPTYPTHTQFSHTNVRKGHDRYGIWREINDFSTSEHSGTHIDAPVHFNQHGWKLDDIPIERLWRIPAVVIDVSKQVSSSIIQNYEIKVIDLEQWESANGVIPDGSLVLLRTGWAAKVGNLTNYSGIDQNEQLNFPGLGEGAGKWLANHGSRNGHKMGVIGVGIDTLSIDVGRSVRYPAHVTLLKKNIFALENMANLDKLPNKGVTATILPVRIGGGSGAPARIIAEVQDPNEITNSSWCFQAPGMMIMTMVVALAARNVLGNM